MESRSASGSRPETNVLAAYDSKASGLRALGAYARFRAHFNGSRRTDFSLWKISALEDPHVRALASAAARDADVVLISLVGNVAPPEPLRLWLDLWIPRRRASPGVLTTLLSPGFRASENGAQLKRFLQRAAALGGLDHAFGQRAMRDCAEAHFGGIRQDPAGRDPAAPHSEFRRSHHGGPHRLPAS